MRSPVSGLPFCRLTGVDRQHKRRQLQQVVGIHRSRINLPDLILNSRQSGIEELARQSQCPLFSNFKIRPSMYGSNHAVGNQMNINHCFASRNGDSPVAPAACLECDTLNVPEKWQSQLEGAHTDRRGV